MIETSKYKIFINIFLWLLFISGFLGMVSKFIISQNGFGENVRFMENLVPINNQDGYGRDTEGNIYLGNLEYSSIHAYNSEGRFLYRIVMNTGGSGNFKFYIDGKDLLHILVYRGEYELVIKGKEVIGLNSIEDINKIEKEYNNILDSKATYISDYKYTNGKLITKLQNGNEEIIILEKKNWPPSVTQYFLVAFISIISLLIINRKILVSIYKKYH